MAIKRQIIANDGEDVEMPEPSYTAGEKVKWLSLLENQEIPQQVNTELLYDPAVPFLSIYTREIKTYVHMKTFK